MGVYIGHYWVHSVYVGEDGIRLRRSSARQSEKAGARLCCAVEIRFPLVTLLVLDY